jgi:ATP-dependent DNA ligase
VLTTLAKAEEVAFFERNPHLVRSYRDRLIAVALCQSAALQCTVGTKTFDALIFGSYEGDRLMYAARTRNGFTPIVRGQLFKKLRGLEIKDCPFVNLPEAKSGRWGAGQTAAKMKDCRWLKPLLVAQIEFLEWTGENHLRHTKFIALRDDKPAREVRRE